MGNLPVIIMDPSTGHKNPWSSVSVLLNIAGVDANLQKGKENIENWSQLVNSTTKNKSNLDDSMDLIHGKQIIEQILTSVQLKHSHAFYGQRYMVVHSHVTRPRHQIK